MGKKNKKNNNKKKKNKNLPKIKKIYNEEYERVYFEDENGKEISSPINFYQNDRGNLFCEWFPQNTHISLLVQYEGGEITSLCFAETNPRSKGGHAPAEKVFEFKEKDGRVTFFSKKGDSLEEFNKQYQGFLCELSRVNTWAIRDIVTFLQPFVESQQKEEEPSDVEKVEEETSTVEKAEEETSAVEKVGPEVKNAKREDSPEKTQREINVAPRRTSLATYLAGAVKWVGGVNRIAKGLWKKGDETENVDMKEASDVGEVTVPGVETEVVGESRAEEGVVADEKSEEALNNLEVAPEKEEFTSTVANPTPPSYTPNIEWKIIKQGGNYTVCDQQKRDVKEDYPYTVTDFDRYGGKVVSFQGTTVDTDKLSITSCRGVSVLKLPKTVNTSSENAKTEVVIDATNANAPKGLHQITVAEDSKINTMEIQGRRGNKLTIFPNFLPKHGVLKLKDCQFNTLNIRGDIDKMQFSIEMDAETYNSLIENNKRVLDELQEAGKLLLPFAETQSQTKETSSVDDPAKTETKLPPSVPASVSVVDIGVDIENNGGMQHFIIDRKQNPVMQKIIINRNQRS